MHLFQLPQLTAQQKSSGRLYNEFLRVPSLSAGTYILDAGAADPQKPHTEDEVYYVISGRGFIQVAGEDKAVTRGSLVFVKARAAHHFHTITEELVLLVFFAPAEGSTAAVATN
jgi:mannose-6-phosphate isomerase-like protein (cupin superfamily)